MKQRQWGLYAIALAILVVGLVWAGVPVSTLLVAGLVLVCPLMMLVMMRGMHGGVSGPGHTQPDQRRNSGDPTDEPHHVSR